MIDLSFRCPACEESARLTIAESDTQFACPHCHRAMVIEPETVADGALSHCLVCGSNDLFIRKDFPQRLGLWIVVVGFAVSCVTWYLYYVKLTFAVLFTTALADLVLYLFMGESLVCYRCGAEYRKLDSLKNHEPFNLETHERYRQLAARLKQTTAGRATAGTPAAAEGLSPSAAVAPRDE
jgi:DNA-directed RNA polymerase subunit RPC12/RpoP